MVKLVKPTRRTRHHISAPLGPKMRGRASTEWPRRFDWTPRSLQTVFLVKLNCHQSSRFVRVVLWIGFHYCLWSVLHHQSGWTYGVVFRRPKSNPWVLCQFTRAKFIIQPQLGQSLYVCCGFPCCPNRFIWVWYRRLVMFQVFLPRIYSSNLLDIDEFPHESPFPTTDSCGCSWM